MSEIIVILNGDNFSSLNTFYDEVERKFTQNLDWKIGRNLDACNDVMKGGFGVYEYEEPITIIWENSSKSKNDLDYKETVKYIKAKLKTCHPSNIDGVKMDLELAKQNKGDTLFEIIVKIIKSHQHINLKLV